VSECDKEDIHGVAVRGNILHLKDHYKE